MIKTLTISLICLFFFGFIEHAKGQDGSNLKKLKIEKQVDSVFHSMIKSAENLEYDKLSQGVDDKNNAGFIINDSYYAQYDSLIFKLKARSQGLSRQNITILKEKITVLSESIVLVTAYGDAIVEVNTGNIFTLKFYWSFVYDKLDNKWKVIQSHQSSSR
jgi:hypothetical protein